MAHAGKRSSSWRAVRCPNGVCHELWAKLDSCDREFVARRSIMSPGRVNAWIKTKVRRAMKRAAVKADEELGR